MAGIDYGFNNVPVSAEILREIEHQLNQQFERSLMRRVESSFWSPVTHAQGNWEWQKKNNVYYYPRNEGKKAGNTVWYNSKQVADEQVPVAILKLSERLWDHLKTMLKDMGSTSPYHKFVDLAVDQKAEVIELLMDTIMGYATQSHNIVHKSPDDFYRAAAQRGVEHIQTYLRNETTLQRKRAENNEYPNVRVFGDGSGSVRLGDDTVEFNWNGHYYFADAAKKYAADNAVTATQIIEALASGVEATELLARSLGAVVAPGEGTSYRQFVKFLSLRLQELSKTAK